MPERRRPTATPEQWKGLFLAQASSPSLWRSTAWALLRSADHIFEAADSGKAAHLAAFQAPWSDNELHPDDLVLEPASEEEAAAALDATLHPVAWLLAGLALENVAKGALLRLNPTWLSSDGELDPRLTNHDLLTLVGQVLPDVSLGEIATLKALQTVITWMGRYPVPKKWGALGPSRRLWLTIADRDTLTSLFERLDSASSGHQST